MIPYVYDLRIDIQSSLIVFSGGLIGWPDFGGGGGGGAQRGKL